MYLGYGYVHKKYNILCFEPVQVQKGGPKSIPVTVKVLRHTILFFSLSSSNNFSRASKSSSDFKGKPMLHSEWLGVGMAIPCNFCSIALCSLSSDLISINTLRMLRLKGDNSKNKVNIKEIESSKAIVSNQKLCSLKKKHEHEFLFLITTGGMLVLCSWECSAGIF